MRVRASARLALALSATPIAVGLAARFLPHVRVSPGWADLLSFGGATSVPISSLALAAPVELPLSVASIVAAASSSALITLAFIRPAPVAALLIADTALVALAWAVGSSVGRRVQHPAHLFPACVVAASADLISLLSPEGPSHAIAGSERALSLLAVSFPVPGTVAIAPALGVGDLLFIGLAFGVVHAHRLPAARSFLLCLLGTALAGAAAAYSGTAIPALVPIALLLVLGLPSIRQLRPADRPAAMLSIVFAVSLALAALARGLLARS